jgi:sugar phosphate isomerase/epimerase
MRLGIGTYSFMWAIGFPGAKPANPMSSLALLARAKEFGVGVVQFGPNMPLEHLGEQELCHLIQEAKRSSIVLEYGTRGLDPIHLRKQICFAARLSSSLLRTVPEFEVHDFPSLSGLAAQLRSVLPDLEKYGVRLAIENGNLPALALASLVRELNSPWVGIALDTVNSLAIPEGTRQIVETLAPYAFSFHVKDFLVRRAWHRMGFVVEGCPAGKGQMEIEWILSQLRSAGANPNAILELWPPEQPQLERTIALEDVWAKESIEYLRKYLPS